MRRLTLAELASAELTVDAVYEGRRGGNAGDNPLPMLIGVSNQVAFATSAPVNSPN